MGADIDVLTQVSEAVSGLKMHKLTLQEKKREGEIGEEEYQEKISAVDAALEQLEPIRSRLVAAQRALPDIREMRGVRSAEIESGFITLNPFSTKKETKPACQLVVDTDEISISYEGEEYVLGTYRLVIDLLSDDSPALYRIAVYQLSGWYKSDRGYHHPHPHISGHTLWYKPAEEQVEQYDARCDFTALVRVLLQVMQTADPEYWVEPVCLWPKKGDPEKKTGSRMCKR